MNQPPTSTSTSASASITTTSTSSTWDTKLQQAKETATLATRLELAKSYSDAFEHYIRAGQTYLWLVRNLAPGPSEKREKLKSAAVKVMQRAEKIKAYRQDVKPVERLVLSHEEQSIALDESATIGSVRLPLWHSNPNHNDDAFSGAIWTDTDPQPCVSPQQLQHLAQYSRNPKSRDLGGFGMRLQGRDIVQDIVTDCSFVAALEVAAQHDWRWHTKITTSGLFPKDANGNICQSANGKYQVRLFVNGAARRVTIDDSLPCYPDGRLMCATSRQGQQTWPALLEKAYLKVMGGYDFLGSNSSIDLYALTGWIPEHVFLRHAGFQREKMWTRISAAWNAGKCMITAGTGPFREPAAAILEDGLVPSHNYAVLELIERQSRRYVCLMNPWRTVTRRPTLAVSVEEESQVLGNNQNDTSFLMGWDELCTHFDSIYLNWDVDMFSHQLSIHSTWRAVEKTVTEKNSVGQNPQFRLEVQMSPTEENRSLIKHPIQTRDVSISGNSNGDDNNDDNNDDTIQVWLLLTRHIKASKKPGDDDDDEYIALHVFEHQERHRIYKPRSGMKLGAYVDGTHNLVRFLAKRSKPNYTVVVSRHGPAKAVNYTLSAFSSATLNLTQLPHAYAYQQKVAGSWTSRTAGGNVTCPTFMNNPQYLVTISSGSTGAGSAADKTANLLLLLEAARELPVQVSLVWSATGSRISHCVEGDVAMSSSTYNHGITVAHRTALQPGTYILILSTFEPGQLGPYTLTAECSVPIEIKPIPAEGAGMFCRTLRDRWSIPQTAKGSPSNPDYHQNPSWRITVSKPSVFTVRLKTHLALSRPYINVAMFYQVDDARIGNEVATSGSYADYICGVAIDSVRLQPGVYRLVVSTFDANVQAQLVLDVYSDRMIDISPVVAK